MSRSEYSDDVCEWDLIRWRGAVTSAIRGKRVQAFLQEMITALRRLYARQKADCRRFEEILKEKCMCAMGAIAEARGKRYVPARP